MNHEPLPAQGPVDVTAGRRVLDPCCGSRMMWFDRQHPDVIFGDRRSETLTVTDRSHGNESGTRTLRIEPDELLDFRALPYPDGSFKLVAFDPPHLERAGPKSWLAAKYGKLGPDWREDLRQGFAECFRVLATDGVLVFKWNETQVKVGEVLALTPVQPLFGHPTGRKGLTHWLVFMKPNVEVRGPTAALSPEAPSRLPGWGMEDKS
jgi:SAM-dependent methyltransferase